jgi:DNA-binding transcriptional MerR regulator
MTGALTIAAAARESGVPARTIRFYEQEGVVPAPRRTAAGYRLYSELDVRRLRLARAARLLGLGLDEIRSFIDQAFSADCTEYVGQLVDHIARQRQSLRQQIEELQQAHRELDAIEAHVRHVGARAAPGRRVATCNLCPLIDEGG